MSQSIFDLISETLEGHRISPEILEKALQSYLSTLHSYVNENLFRSEIEKDLVNDLIDVSESFKIQLELSILFKKVKEIRG